MPVASARASVSGVTMAPAVVLAAVDPVGVAGDAPRRPAWPFSGHREGQQELDVAAAATLAAHGHRGLAAREQHARRRQRLAVPGAPSGRSRP